MLLDLNQKFVNFDGKIVQDVRVDEETGVETKRDLTLYRVLILALIEPAHKIADGVKVEYFELALTLNTAKAGMVELTAEEIVILQNAIKSRYRVLIVGEAMRMLDGKPIGIEIINVNDDTSGLVEFEDAIDINTDVLRDKL